MSFTPTAQAKIYTTIVEHIQQYECEFDLIPEDRQKTLQKLSQFIADKHSADEKAELIFICTHNSRRSHISQIWAQTAAAYFAIPHVIAYSGGTEATAFNPRAVKAMQEIGFRIIDCSGGPNPIYDVRFADNTSPMKVFSKKYDAQENPVRGFGAVMTCTHADQHCPSVSGAEIRIVLPYDDPKNFDGTSLESTRYSERAHQIGRDIVYAFSLIQITSL
jgi:arsenate reductase